MMTFILPEVIGVVVRAPLAARVGGAHEEHDQSTEKRTEVNFIDHVQLTERSVQAVAISRLARVRGLRCC